MNVLSAACAASLLLGFRRQVIDDERRSPEQVEVDAEQPVGRLAAHEIGDECAHVTTLGDKAGVAKPVHELRPGLGNAARVPASLSGLAGETVAGQ